MKLSCHPTVQPTEQSNLGWWCFGTWCLYAQSQCQRFIWLLIYIKQRWFQAKSAEASEVEETQSKKDEKFKARRMRLYENRIRQYSNPDKIFRYFATISAQFPNGTREDIYMTPDDFVRSLTIDGDLQVEG